MTLQIRQATVEDVPEILRLIRALAEYDWRIFRVQGEALRQLAAK